MKVMLVLIEVVLDILIGVVVKTAHLVLDINVGPSLQKALYSIFLSVSTGPHQSCHPLLRYSRCKRGRVWDL
jgi:hypothetical protein